MIAQEQTTRFDIYRFIHKGIRAYMCDILITVGRLDPHDADEVRTVTARVRELLTYCVAHLSHENDHVHAAMESRHPASSARIAGEHVDHRRACQELATDVMMVETSQGQARETAVLQLYHHLSHFVVENFVHMLVEEQDHNAVLWQHFSDDELRALEHAIVSSLTPEETMTTMRWMVPALSPGERAALLGDIQNNAPAEVLTAILSVVQPHLTEKDRGKLAVALASSKTSVAA